MLITFVIITILVLSSCTISVPNTQAHTIFNNYNTKPLNCAGLFEDGYFISPPFSLPQSAVLEIEAGASNRDLPPTNFDIYIMTQRQFNTYCQIWANDENVLNAPYLYKWDLAKDYNGQGYYLNKFTYQIPPGHYYIVLANNYYQSEEHVCGSAAFSLIAYYK